MMVIASKGGEASFVEKFRNKDSSEILIFFFLKKKKSCKSRHRKSTILRFLSGEISKKIN
jgi:hypothetical protein